MARSSRRRSSGLSVLLLLLLAASPAWAQFHRLPGYTYATLPVGAPVGSEARVTDQANAIYMHNGTAWLGIGNFPGPLDPSIPYGTNPTTYRGIVGIGTALDSVSLSVNAAVYSPGTATSVRIAPTMFPSVGTAAGLVSGDARALYVSPTITMNPNALGFTSGSNTHKWIVSAWIEGPNIPVSTGLPQEIAILRLGPNGTATAPDLTQASAGLAVNALRIQGNLPNKIEGSIFLNVSGNGAVQNIHTGLQDGTPGDGEWHANALRIASKIGPLGDGTKNAGGEGFTARIGGSIITDTAGTHENLGTLDLRTPTIATAGGATVVAFSTLKVGNAPTGGNPNRALWVGTGRSDIEGNLIVGTNLTLGSVTPTKTLSLQAPSLNHGSTSATNVTNLGTTSVITDFAILSPADASSGGLIVQSMSSNNGGTTPTLALSAFGGAAMATKATNTLGLIHLYATPRMTGNSLASFTADEAVLTIAGRVGGADTTLLILDAEGDVWITGMLSSVGFTLVGLGTPVNGKIAYCTDCAHGSNPCTSASTGAIAKRLNGAWVC